MLTKVKEKMQSIFENKKLLLVGAGGIGCEVVKNLIKFTVEELHIVDMDRIELSNLNR